MSVLALACAKEPVGGGEEAGVSFSIEVPGAQTTKAIGDGETAKKLYYQVFDKDGAAIEGLGVQTTDITGKTATVKFQLVKDQDYNFVFWAQTAADGYYTVDATDGLKKITANYAGKNSNDENFDAFYAVKKMTVTGPVSETVKLTRPFAQINIATAGQISAGTATKDIDFTGAASAVTVKGIPTVFSPLAATDVFTGNTDVTFAKAEAPAGNITVNGKDYKYLAVNYVFAPVDGTVYDVNATLTIEGKDVSLTVPTVPAKQNWRTNIVGDLLTAGADFTVVVDPVFGGDDTPRAGYKDANGVAEALPATPVMNGSVINVTAANAQYTLDGAYGSISGKTINFTENITEPLYFARPTKYSGSNTKYMVGGFDSSAANYQEFATAEEISEYVSQPGVWTPGCYYIRTIENVKFTANAGVTVAGFEFKTGHFYEANNVVPHDCVRDGYFAVGANNGFMCAAIVKNISFEGVDFAARVNIENSIPETDFDGLTFKGCSFTTGNTDICIHIGNWADAQNYEVFKNLLVENCEFKDGTQGVYCNPVIGVKVIGSTFENMSSIAVNLQTGSNGINIPYGVSEISGNTFTNIVDRVIRINNLSSGTELTIKNNVSTDSGRLGTDGSRSVVKAGILENGIVYHISNNSWNGGNGIVENEELKDYDWTKAAQVAGATVKLEAETYSLPETVADGVTIEGVDGTVIDMENKIATGYKNVTFKNVTVKTGTEIYKGFQHAAGVLTFDSCTFTGMHFGYGEKEIYKNCTFNQTKAEYHMWTYGGNIDYIGCTFNGKGKFLHIYNEGNGGNKTTINIEDCTFNNSLVIAGKPAINIKGTCNSTALAFDVNIKNCTLTGKFPATNGGLWQVDNPVSDMAQNKVKVTVDGTVVYPAE